MAKFNNSASLSIQQILDHPPTVQLLKILSARIARLSSGQSYDLLREGSSSGICNHAFYKKDRSVCLTQLTSVLRANCAQKWQSHLLGEAAAPLNQCDDHVFRKVKNTEDELDRSSIEGVIVLGPLVGANARAFRSVGQGNIFLGECGLRQTSSRQVMFKETRRKDNASAPSAVDAVLTHVSSLAFGPLLVDPPLVGAPREFGCLEDCLTRAHICRFFKLTSVNEHVQGAAPEKLKDNCGWNWSLVGCYSGRKSIDLNACDDGLTNAK